MFTKLGHFIGDTWYFVQGDRVHLFYLTCPLTVPRHTRWSIAHAVSNDLVTWEDCGVVLEPGETGSWDGICPATGSVIEFEGRYYMAYSGNFAGPKPSVGIAVSEDLYVWKKLQGNPVTTIDGVYYSWKPNLAWTQPRWRDPFLIRDQDKIYQLVTAARHDLPEERAGTVGLAVTSDMKHWELLPPLEVPGIAQDLECPKLSKVGSQYLLTVSISDSIVGDELRSRQPAGLPIATAYTLVAESFLGPYSMHGTGRILEADSWGSPYACEPVLFKGRHFLMGTIWSDILPDSVCDPIPIEATKHGFKAEPGAAPNS